MKKTKIKQSEQELKIRNEITSIRCQLSESVRKHDMEKAREQNTDLKEKEAELRNLILGGESYAK